MATTKQKQLIIWLPVFLIALVLSFLTINNKLELPFHDKARDVVRFEYRDGQEIAVDDDGEEVKDWQANNYADDIIKGALVLLALVAYWKLVALVVHKLWLRILIVIVSVPAFIVSAFLLTFAFYGFIEF
jgi:hypothetical protein